MRSRVVFRWVLLCVLAATFTAFSAKAAFKYASGLTGVSIAEKPTTKFPAVSLCAMPLVFNLSAPHKPFIKSIFHSVVGPNDTSQYVQHSEDSLPTVLDKTIYYMATPTIYLACDVFTPTGESRNGFQNVLEFKLDHGRLPGVAYLHLDHSDYLYPFAGDVLAFPAGPPPPGPHPMIRRVKVSIRVGRKSSLSRAERPCLIGAEGMEGQPNMRECFIQFMAQRISCFGDGSYLGDCTMEQLTELALVTQMFSKLDESEAELQSVIDLPSGMVASGATTWEERVYLEFHIPEAVVVEMTEYLLYDLGSFVGEVGGLAGIFLGASLLTAYDDLFRCYDRAKARAKAKANHSNLKLRFSA